MNPSHDEFLKMIRVYCYPILQLNKIFFTFERLSLANRYVNYLQKT